MQDMSEKATKTWVLALTSVASFMVALDALVVTTALSTIRIDLGASIEALEWTVNAYNLSFAVLLLTGAALGDRLGRRRMFAAGLALFVVASAACALASNIGALIAARAVQGAGAALVMPLAMALLSAAFPREERAKALGIFSAVTGLALIAGPVAGGAIAEGLAWQWIFWINLPIGADRHSADPPSYPRERRARDRPRYRRPRAGDRGCDGRGLGVDARQQCGLAEPRSRVGARGRASFSPSAFVVWELRAREPMVPMRLFRSRAFSSGHRRELPVLCGDVRTLFFLPQFLQVAQGFGPFGVGLRLLPWTATLFVFAPLGGSLVNRLGERPLVVVGLMLQAIGMAWIALIATPGLAYIDLVAPLILTGAGVSMAMPAAQNAVLGAVAPSEIGKASGIFNMARFLGGVFGVAVQVAVFAAIGNFGSPQAFGTGFVAAMGAAAAMSLLAAIAGLRLPGRRAVALVSANAREPQPVS